MIVCLHLYIGLVTYSYLMYEYDIPRGPLHLSKRLKTLDTVKLFNMYTGQ